MNLRERMSKNITRAGTKAGDHDLLAQTEELVQSGLRASAVVALTGLPAHTIKLMIDRDVGIRRSGRQPGSIERLQDDASLRLHCSVFVHAYLQARERSQPFLDARPFVRAWRTLAARAPAHGVSADLCFYAIQQVELGHLALERCIVCGAHFLRITLEKDVKRTLTGDCFMCSYRYRTPGRTASWSGRELLAQINRQN